jgi:hypothetical protein
MPKLSKQKFVVIFLFMVMLIEGLLRAGRKYPGGGKDAVLTGAGASD